MPPQAIPEELVVPIEDRPPVPVRALQALQRIGLGHDGVIDLRGRTALNPGGHGDPHPLAYQGKDVGELDSPRRASGRPFAGGILHEEGNVHLSLEEIEAVPESVVLP